jgi:hypothetical protein
MAATAPPPPTLDTLPADVLARMLLSPEELLAVAGVNRALRSALDAPQHASLWPLWASVVMRRADPAASLALASRGARPPPDEADAAAWLTEEEVAASRVHKMYARCTQIEREPTIGFDGSVSGVSEGTRSRAALVALVVVMCHSEIQCAALRAQRRCPARAAALVVPFVRRTGRRSFVLVVVPFCTAPAPACPPLPTPHAWPMDASSLAAGGFGRSAVSKKLRAVGSMRWIASV